MKNMEALFKLWAEYKKDKSVLENPNPPTGVIFSFEGFWQWLLKKYNI